MPCGRFIADEVSTRYHRQGPVAGIVGFVSARPADADLDAGLRSLCHGSKMVHRIVADTPRLRLGLTYRPTDDAAWDVFDKDAGVGVVLYGWALRRDYGWRRLDARAILESYLETGADALCSLDGGFIAVVADLQARRLLIANDRTATVPMHLLEEDGRFAFAPEAKAIHAILACPMRLHTPALLSFLSLGHALGGETLIEGVRLLEPAQLVEVSLDTAEATCTTYWTLRFAPRRAMTEREAAERLHGTLLECHRALLADRPLRTQLLLTGGLDSRTVLAMLSSLGRPPDEAVTWGVDDRIPHSDPVIAASLAAGYGVPFRFIRYDADTFPQHAQDWAWVSELGSDNLGSFAGGQYLLLGTDGPPAPAVLIGDQMLGTGGLPLDRRDAIEIALGLPYNGLAPGIRGLLRTERRDEVGALVASRIGALVERCPGNAPKDLLDFLGLHVRVARWLNAPAPFREPMVCNRRPMMLAPAIDLFQELPQWLRVDKKTLVAMHRRCMPEFVRWPRSSANSLVDWNRAFSAGGAAVSFFRGLVDDGAAVSATLAHYLDPTAVDRAVARYCDRPRQEISRRLLPERVLPRLRRSLSGSRAASIALRVAERSAHRLRGQPLGASEPRVITRLALIGLLQRSLGGAHGAGGKGGPEATLERWRLER